MIIVENISINKLSPKGGGGRGQQFSFNIQLKFKQNNDFHFHFSAAAAEKGLTSMQKEWNQERIGRDLHAAFARWKSTEAAAVRLVRLACDLLGPRGDLKCGCRDEWLAFCELNNIKSLIPSYRGNRFNAHFQGAAMVLYHKENIIELLQDHLPSRNRKQDSVLLDAKSDSVTIFLMALAILYYKFTLPYHNLVLSKSTKYAQFYIPITQMHTSLSEYAEDPAPLFDPALPPFFPISQPDQDRLATILNSVSDEQKQCLSELMKVLCKEFVVTTNNQLSDFLPGGRYHNITDPNVLRRLEHSQVHNLLGEACFGDLDFTLFAKRNSSIHHASTINMLKRNATMEWLENKSDLQQERLLNMSASKGEELRKRHREQQREVSEAKRRKLETEKEKKEAKEREGARLRAAISAEVRQHGGPCQLASDVDIMLRQLPTQKAKIQALKSEMRYFKLVLGFTSPELKLTQPLDDLTNSLKQFLEEEVPFGQHEEHESFDFAFHEDMCGKCYLFTYFNFFFLFYLSYL